MKKASLEISQNFRENNCARVTHIVFLAFTGIPVFQKKALKIFFVEIRVKIM